MSDNKHLVALCGFALQLTCVYAFAQAEQESPATTTECDFTPVAETDDRNQQDLMLDFERKLAQMDDCEVNASISLGGSSGSTGVGGNGGNTNGDGGDGGASGESQDGQEGTEQETLEQIAQETLDSADETGIPQESLRPDATQRGQRGRQVDIEDVAAAQMWEAAQKETNPSRKALLLNTYHSYVNSLKR